MAKRQTTLEILRLDEELEVWRPPQNFDEPVEAMLGGDDSSAIAFVHNLGEAVQLPLPGEQEMNPAQDSLLDNQPLVMRTLLDMGFTKKLLGGTRRAISPQELEGLWARPTRVAGFPDEVLEFVQVNIIHGLLPAQPSELDIILSPRKDRGYWTVNVLAARSVVEALRKQGLEVRSVSSVEWVLPLRKKPNQSVSEAVHLPIPKRDDPRQQQLFRTKLGLRGAWEEVKQEFNLPQEPLARFNIAKDMWRDDYSIPVEPSPPSNVRAYVTVLYYRDPATGDFHTFYIRPTVHNRVSWTMASKLQAALAMKPDVQQTSLPDGQNQASFKSRELGEAVELPTSKRDDPHQQQLFRAKPGLTAPWEDVIEQFGLELMGKPYNMDRNFWNLLYSGEVFSSEGEPMEGRISVTIERDPSTQVIKNMWIRPLVIDAESVDLTSKVQASMALQAGVKQTMLPDNMHRASFQAAMLGEAVQLPGRHGSPEQAVLFQTRSVEDLMHDIREAGYEVGPTGSETIKWIGESGKQGGFAQLCLVGSPPTVFMVLPIRYQSGAAANVEALGRSLASRGWQVSTTETVPDGLYIRERTIRSRNPQEAVELPGREEVPGQQNLFRTFEQLERDLESAGFRLERYDGQSAIVNDDYTTGSAFLIGDAEPGMALLRINMRHTVNHRARNRILVALNKRGWRVHGGSHYSRIELTGSP